MTTTWDSSDVGTKNSRKKSKRKVKGTEEHRAKEPLPESAPPCGEAKGHKAEGNCTADEDGAKYEEQKVQKENLTYGQIDAKYVGRSTYLFNQLLSLAEYFHDRAELAAMNHKKNGHPYAYTHSLMMAIATIRHVLNMDLRSCEGMARAVMARAGKDEQKAPSYSQISRRLNELDVSIRDGVTKISSEDFVVNLSPDGTGLTPSARGEYVRVVHKLRRGFLRLVIMIRLDTLEIVSFSIADDSVGETSMFTDLLENALASLGIDIGERRRAMEDVGNPDDVPPIPIVIRADGAYDTREVFSQCKKLGIVPIIRVRTNANCSAGGADMPRSRAVLEQLGGDNATPAKLAAMSAGEREANRKRWKDRVLYGSRWLVEIVISAFKRRYGNTVRCKNMENIVREIAQKVCIYNSMLHVGREAAMRA